MGVQNTPVTYNPIYRSEFLLAHLERARYPGDSLRDLRWRGDCWPWDRNLNLPISHWHPEIKGYCTLW